MNEDSANLEVPPPPSVPEPFRIKFNEETYTVAYREHGHSDFVRYCLSDFDDKELKARKVPVLVYYVDKYYTKEAFNARCKLLDELADTINNKTNEYSNKNVLESLGISDYETDKKNYQIKCQHYWYNFDMSVDEETRQVKPLNAVLAIDGLIFILQVLFREEYYVRDLCGAVVSFNHMDEIIIDRMELGVSLNSDAITLKRKFTNEMLGKNIVHNRRHDLTMMNVRLNGTLEDQLIADYAIIIAEMLWTLFFPKYGSLPKAAFWTNGKVKLINHYQALTTLYDKKPYFPDTYRLILDIVQKLIDEPRVKFADIKNCLTSELLMLINKNISTRYMDNGYTTVVDNLIDEGLIPDPAEDYEEEEEEEEEDEEYDDYDENEVGEGGGVGVDQSIQQVVTAANDTDEDL